MERLEGMRHSRLGNGETECILCGETFRFYHTPSRCVACGKMTLNIHYVFKEIDGKIGRNEAQ